MLAALEEGGVTTKHMTVQEKTATASCVVLSRVEGGGGRTFINAPSSNLVTSVESLVTPKERWRALAQCTHVRKLNLTLC